MVIESPTVGKVEFDEEDLIRFPSGLIGLGSCERFLLLDLDEDLPLGWLQCVDDPALGLPVADPRIFFPSYHLDASREILSVMDVESEEDLVLLIVIIVHAGAILVTGNLRAPLAVDRHSRRGQQIVLERPDLDLRTPVDPARLTQGSLPSSIRGGVVKVFESVVT